MYICIVCVIRFVPDFSFSSTSNAHMHDFLLYDDASLAQILLAIFLIL